MLADGLWVSTATSAPTRVSRLLTHSTDFKLVSLYNADKSLHTHTLLVLLTILIQTYSRSCVTSLGMITLITQKRKLWIRESKHIALSHADNEC